MDVADIISGGAEFSPGVFILLGLVLFGWLLASGIFSYETRKGKALLKDIVLHR